MKRDGSSFVEITSEDVHSWSGDGLACTNASTLDLINQRPVISPGKYLTPHRSASSTWRTKGGEGGRVLFLVR